MSATGSIQIVRGACGHDCPDTCSWIVTVEAGRAVKLQGDRAHPFTRGALCNKLNDYIAYTQSPDRLLYPMRRFRSSFIRRIDVCFRSSRETMVSRMFSSFSINSASP